MALTLTIRDEVLGGAAPYEWTLELPNERTTVREIIRGRVYQEVQDHNRKQEPTFRGLVQPEEAELTLNGWKLKTPRQLDWKKQFERAIEAFEQNRILLLIDDQQAEGLDEELELKSGASVTFLRLTPLVGG